jgi:hypothetical protein
LVVSGLGTCIKTKTTCESPHYLIVPDLTQTLTSNMFKNSTTQQKS